MATKREACDRCHNIKSRCSKPRDSGICKRCERFGFSCNYSAPLRLGRPKGRSMGGSGGSSNTTTTENEETLFQLHQNSNMPSETVGTQSESNQAWTDVSYDVDCDFSIFPEPHLEHAISLDPTNFNLQLQWQGNVGQDMTLSSMDCESVSLLDDDIQISPTVPDLPNSTGTKIALATQSNAGTEPEPSRTSFSSLERTSVTYMDKLLALQSKLHTLSGFFSKVGTQNLESEESSASTGVASRDIEETFTATENLVDIIHNLHGTMPFKRPQEPAVCHSMDKRNDSNHEMPSTASGLSDSSTVLLTLSCYLRLLQVYELLVASLHSNVQQSTHDTSRFSTLGASPASSANSSALNAPPVGIPILNIGHFNLATSPDMNIGLMLHFVLEMVERLQTAVQLCAFTAQSSMEGLASSGRRSSTARYTHPAFLNRGGDEVHSSSTVSAVQGVFGAMVSDVGVREEELTQTLYEAKKLLRGKSVSRSRYH